MNFLQAYVISNDENYSNEMPKDDINEGLSNIIIMHAFNRLPHQSWQLRKFYRARYAPRDVPVSGITAYTRLAEGKFRLAKPPTLQENEDLLLRLDTEESAT